MTTPPGVLKTIHKTPNNLKVPTDVKTMGDIEDKSNTNIVINLPTTWYHHLIMICAQHNNTINQQTL